MALSYEKRHDLNIRRSSGRHKDVLVGDFLLLEDDDGSETSALLLESDTGTETDGMKLEDSV